MLSVFRNKKNICSQSHLTNWTLSRSYIQRRTASTVSLGLVLKHIFEDGGAFWWMVLIIFSNRRVCCGIILVPAPIIMQSNFSRESVSETTLSVVSPKSTRQVCTSYPKSISLLIASCAVACTQLASHPVVLARLESINLGSIPVRELFSLSYSPYGGPFLNLCTCWITSFL